MILNFLSKKVLDFQIKKLTEAENNLKEHVYKKEQLEEIQSTETKNELLKEEKMIKIWTKNIDKIKHEINKIKDRS